MERQDRRGELDVAVPDPGTAARSALTRREREVLEQVALGMSNRQIGQALSIAEQTVKNHLSSAMRKLSLHHRTHAVVVALGQGWIRRSSSGVADAPEPDLHASGIVAGASASTE
jgi:two-component system response regulator DegU